MDAKTCTVFVSLLWLAPSVAAQLPAQCNPAAGVGSEVGVELVGTINQTLLESSAETCCYLAYRAHARAWTYEVEGGDICPNQTVLKGIAFDGGGSGSHVVPSNSSDACCSLAVASGRSMWTYDPVSATCSLFYEARGRRRETNSTSGMGRIPGLETCSEETMLDGVAFDYSSSITAVKTNSSGDCCNVAQQSTRSLWSFNKRTKECTVFYELRGRHLDPDVVSAMGSTPNMGTCKIFSLVSGKKANPRAISFENGPSLVLVV